MLRTSSQLFALAAGLAIAGAADAEPLRPLTKAPAAQADLAAAVFARQAEAHPVLPRGIAKTSVDYASPTDGVTGSLGFLCGLKPSADRSGAATARGYDPNGRFLGAKLSFAFR